SANSTSESKSPVTSLAPERGITRLRSDEDCGLRIADCGFWDFGLGFWGLKKILIKNIEIISFVVYFLPSYHHFHLRSHAPTQTPNTQIPNPLSHSSNARARIAPAFRDFPQEFCSFTDRTIAPPNLSYQNSWLYVWRIVRT